MSIQQFTAQDLKTFAVEHRRKEQFFMLAGTKDALEQSYKCKLQAELFDAFSSLAENNWLHRFPCLYDLQGQKITTKLELIKNRFNGRFEEFWTIPQKDGSHIFIKVHPVRPSTMEKKGYREGFEVAPASAKIENGQVMIYRTDGK